MTSPTLALRAGILQRCRADPTLAALMGGTVRLHDEPPRAAVPVYALFAESELRDWSTSSDRGHEHLVTIAVWAAPGSAASALAVGDRLAALLDDAPLALLGHRLVHIAVTALESGRDTATGLARIGVRLRAVTEVEA